MKNFFSAPVLLELCLLGVVADLPYRNFEDVYMDVPAPPQSTTHYPIDTETGGHHQHHHPHLHHSPTDSDPPGQIPHNKYELRHAPPYYHNPHPTSYPTGGYPPHHHHPRHPRHHHHPEGPLGTPPYPKNTEPYLGRLGKDEHVHTMKTATRTCGLLSGGFPPYGTGSPYPYPGKVQKNHWRSCVVPACGFC